MSESVHGLEMQVYEKRLHLSTLLERAGEELGLVEEVLIAEYGPEVPGGFRGRRPGAGSRNHPLRGARPRRAPSVRAEQQKRLADAERKLSQLGRVNPLALEEFAALEQRHKHLTEQLADTAKTKKDLLQIVEEIDGMMQGIFKEAFEDTKAAFADVFPVLFPGGTGSIHPHRPGEPAR